MTTVLESAVMEIPAVPRQRARSSSGGIFAATILISAFLLFEVQPLISKFILPWFGGSPAVWTTAMLFFQVVLFAGYSYAHITTRLLAPGGQMLLHLALLAVAVCLLPIAPDVSWKPVDASEPTWRILALLAACVGLPYLVLASTGPLVQAWFSRVNPGVSPYRLYALSNVGSLAALISYPFYFERALDTTGQAWWWSAGFVLFAALCALCAVRTGRAAEAAAPAAAALAAAVPPTWRQRAAWLALPALASVSLLATTNHVCQDVAVIPFLWVVPLALYLVTFIIAFDHERWYHRRAFALVGGATIFLAATISQFPWDLHFMQELLLYFSAMFLLCMLCHGELVRLKPDPRYLTSFYLMISAGGALGGIFVSLIAPLLFNDYIEWPLSLGAGFLLAVALLASRPAGAGDRRGLRLLAGGALAACGLAEIVYASLDFSGPTAMMRNFYGVATVYEREADNPEDHYFALYNGSIRHGAQYVHPDKRRLPYTYYSPPTGVARSIEYLHDHYGKLRVGTVGLGIGTLAAYARPGDHFMFYEINPDVDFLARKYFSYLSNAGDAAEVELGDARISLEKRQGQPFDLLVLDAFSGDAIPAHLLTSEAFDIYNQHLDPEHATIVIHITNHYLDLAPVVRGLADKFGFGVARLKTLHDSEHGLNRTDWVVMSRDAQLIAELAATPQAVELTDRKIVWTDAQSNLFEILK